MKNSFKTVRDIVHFLEGTGYKIGILGKNFVSCAVLDRRCKRGWRIEYVIKFKITKSAIQLLKMFEKYKIADNAELSSSKLK